MRFSITPSNASFSFRSPSLRLSQYSRSSEVFSVVLTKPCTWAFNSSTVMPSSFSSVVAQTRLTANRSRSGGGGGPFVLLVLDFPSLPDWLLSKDAVESFAACCFSRATEPILSDSDLRDGSRLMSGSTSFFCFEGGNISSRSTGTPRLTKKSRLIRDWVQLGGCKGGGVTSCFHKDRDLSEGNIGDALSIGGGAGKLACASSVLEGNMASRCCCVAARRSGRSESASKSINGYTCCGSSRTCAVCNSGCWKLSSKSSKSSSAPA